MSWLWGLRQLARLLEHRVLHGFRQPACERVLLARMVRTQEYVRPNLRRHSMSETRLTLCCPAQVAQDAQDPFPGKAPQAKDDAHALEQRKLFHEIGKAVIALFDRRPIGRRCAAHARRDVTIA